MKLLQLENLTVRTIGSCPEVTIQAWDSICRAAQFAMDHLELKGHLFVTVVGAVTLQTGPSDNDFGFALYHAGMHHVLICGQPPDEFKSDLDHWLNELKVATIHELVHYWQDLNGTLDGSQENEHQAEQWARSMATLVR